MRLPIGLRTIKRAVTVIAVALGLTTALSWFGRVGAWLEMLTNIPLHLLVLGVIVLVASLVLRLRWPAVIAAVVVAWFAILLVPYWRASPDPLPPSSQVHVVQQYNVYFGNTDIDRIVAEIEAANADVLALHEITSGQWEALAPRLDQWPHVIAEPWDGSDPQLGGGMALLSREPLEPIAVDPLASIEGRPILAASTMVGGTEVVIVGLHPHASRFIGSKVDLRNRQLDAVAALLRNESRPAVILTDLNMTPTSSDYRRFLDDLDWRDPHRETGWDASWPTWGGWFGLPIDHVLVSDDVALHEVTTSGGGGSDHRSVRATISFSR